MAFPNHRGISTPSINKGANKSQGSSENHKQKISLLDQMYQILPKTQQYYPLICNDPVVRDHERRQRRRNIRAQLGKSRSGVQWGPTHSYDSEDEDIDMVLEVEGNNGSSRDDGGGGRKKLCGDGTTTTTQTCSTKEMSSQGYRPPSSKVALSTTASHKQSSVLPSTSYLHSTDPAASTTYSTPLDQRERQDDGSTSALPAATCGTLDKILNQACEFAKDYIPSQQTLGRHCHPCSHGRGDYETVHTVSTKHRQKKKNKQGSNKHQSLTVEPPRPVDINIENVSLDDSSLTSTWIGKDFTKIEQHIKTKVPTVTPSKRSINNSMKENQNPEMNHGNTPTTVNSTIYQSPPPPPPPKPLHRGLSFKNKSSQSSQRNQSVKSHTRTKSTYSMPSLQRNQSVKSHSRNKSTNSISLKQPEHQQQQHISPKTTDGHKQPQKLLQQTLNAAVSKLPFEFVSFSISQAALLEKSISELTMRSCHTEALAIHQQQHQYPSSENRRMAYYAVGRAGGSKSQSGGGPSGNRRCYFSGDKIHSGRPFYAGSVQQGLRTLVVFCLPRTLNLPSRSQLDLLLSTVPKEHRIAPDPEIIVIRKGTSTHTSNSKAHENGKDGATSTHTKNYNVSDDHVADEVDQLLEKGILKAEQVLDILPHPGVGNGVDILARMEQRYPDQYATLPPQVQMTKCWRLYFKFCFFSGLPIADGEMYYKITDKVMKRLKSRSQAKMQNNNGGCGDDLAGVEEIILSHEIMEAVNGELSAQILRLPNKKTFSYLQKQYEQQCAKLGTKVFDRTSWEMVMPEV